MVGMRARWTIPRRTCRAQRRCKGTDLGPLSRPSSTLAHTTSAMNPISSCLPHCRRFRTTLRDTAVAISNEAVRELENESLRTRRLLPPDMMEMTERGLAPKGTTALATSQATQEYEAPEASSRAGSPTASPKASTTDLLRRLSVAMTVPRGSGVAGGSLGSLDGVQNVTRIWTQHEVNMQKVIQRRGGELYILTAAGTKGRVKAPWRRNRFQRLEADLESATLQENQLNMTWEDMVMQVPPVGAKVRVCGS